MANTSAQKKQKNKFVENKNILETINSIGSQTVKTIQNEAKATSDEFFRQLLGQQKELREKKSGEIEAGESVKVNDQLFFERRLFNEERQETSKQLNELRLRLQAIQSEASKMVASTQKLTEDIKVAVMQGAITPSEYQISFFEDIIQIVVNFRKKIDSAIVWLHGTNKRAEKKNYWSQYKKKGAGFLLSGESYSQRSVG